MQDLFPENACAVSAVSRPRKIRYEYPISRECAKGNTPAELISSV